MRLQKLIKIILTLSLLVGGVVKSNAVILKSSGNFKAMDSEQEQLSARDSIIYKTDLLAITKLSTNVYVHETFLQTETFGKVACNGMIVLSDNQAVIFDSPSNDESAKELINFVADQLQSKINAVVATHFHADCIGGLKAFHDQRIPSYANQRTIQILKSLDPESTAIPQNGINQSLTLYAGREKVYAEYFGEGHTKDNIVGYFPKGKTLFGGCLIKEAGASKGNLEDANVLVWSQTVRKLQQKYSDMKTVIPGHGKPGGTELLDYTIELFR